MYRDETIDLMNQLPAATRAIKDLMFTLIQQASDAINP
jgi:DNA-binding FrmR family transcriptional regulator